MLRSLLSRGKDCWLPGIQVSCHWRLVCTGWLVCFGLGPLAAQAQITPGGLTTRVNGSSFGSCTSGSCTIHGGVKAGSNLFYRISNFDTRKGIREVIIQNQNQKNVILSVTARPGSFINKPIELANDANLFWLSPGGITIGRGASFVNVSNLLLTTSAKLPFGGLGDKQFDAFQSTPSQLVDLDQSPSPDFERLTEQQITFGKGLIGNGSINIEGGLISVDRNLLIDATSGSLRLGTESDLTLVAGESIRLRANQVSMSDSQLAAGERERGGLIDIQAVAAGAPSIPGTLTVQNSAMEAQRILLSGNQVLIDQSVIRAPKGWIQLAAWASPGNSEIRSQPALLSLSRSILDVSPSRQEHLSADALEPLTQLVGSQKRDQKIAPPRVPYPVIAMISDGSIQVSENTTLNASFDLTRLAQPSRDPEGVDFWRIADRSGLVLLSARQDIVLDRSRIDVNASHNKAGVVILKAGKTVAVRGQPVENPILMTAGGADDRKYQIAVEQLYSSTSIGKVRFENSEISATGGAGNGVVLLSGNDGISISNSTIDVSNDRIPIVNGSAYGELNGDIRPYLFYGGSIVLDNISLDKPIEISSSRLLATTSSAGGGLASSLYSTTVIPSIIPDEVVKFGFYGNLPAFGFGQDNNNTGGSIYAYSLGGIRIRNHSLLEASAGLGMPENIAGFVSLEDRGRQGISLQDSMIRAVSGASPGGLNRDLQTGKVAIDAAANLSFFNSKLDVSSANVDDILNINKPANPQIGLSSQSGKFLFEDTQLLAVYAADESSGRNIQVTGPGASDLVGRFAPLPSVDLEYYGPIEIDTTTYASPIAQSLLDRADEVLKIPLFSQSGINVEARIGEEIPDLQSVQPVIPSDAATTVAVAAPDLNATAFTRSEASNLQQIAKALGLPKGSGRVRSIPELQQALLQARDRRVSGVMPIYPSSPLPSPSDLPSALGARRAQYVPAILQLQRDDQVNGISRITAIVLTAAGQPISRSTTVPSNTLNQWILASQQQLSRRSLEAVEAPREARNLANHLLQPIADSLASHGITALLLSVDRGLQGIPYAVLPIDGKPLAERFALTITPSLGLIDLNPARAVTSQSTPAVLLAGATHFSNGLAPLPMVKEELQMLSKEQSASILLNESFTPQALVQQAQSNSIRRLHIATHANFKPGSLGLLYTARESLSLKQLGRSLVFRNSEQPLDLISLSGCLTALGDEQSELGFVGMALQTGARSGIGSLWEVDDTATAAFFVQFYRYLQQGLSKDQALQATQRAFLHGDVSLDGDQLVGPVRLDSGLRTPLVVGISREEQQLFAQGLSHPYYWAGMVLTGSPW